MSGRAARIILALVLALSVPILLAYLGLARRFGAHPWWDLKVALIGAPIGCILGFGMLWLPRTPRVVLTLVIADVAAVTAYFGKSRFAASFAEDAFAGKLWYFGWIGVAAGLAMRILAIVLPTRR